ncbi:MAG TPA: hypothetical protein VJN70_21050 [Gemmatimonadaceae bacterium]|nr:hypothetical protein [Gemmatimonadaceae bacterium]
MCLRARVEPADVSAGDSRQEHDAASVQRAFRQRAALNQNLWMIASTAGRTNPTSLIVASFVTSANDVMDANLTRSVLAQGGRIPRAIVVELYVILAATMGMIGYEIGVAGS